MLSTAAGKAKTRDGDGRTLDGDQAARALGCCSPVSQLLRAGVLVKSGSGRSLNSLSIEPRRCWRIYELISLQQQGGETRTRLLLSSEHLLLGGGWLSDALCSRAAVFPTAAPPPQSPSRLQDTGARWGGPYPQGWCRTPAGCSTRGCRMSCRTRTRWPPARSRDADHGSHLLQPSQTPPTTPKTPQGAKSPQHNAAAETGTALPTGKAAGGANSIRDPQDPSGPDASLTIKAEKTPFWPLDTGEMGPSAHCR